MPINDPRAAGSAVKTFAILGAVSAFLGVALGAFAAHLLKDRLPPDLFAVFEVGVRYQMYHALGMILVAWGISQFPDARLSMSGWLFAAGTVIFSGSLYLLSLTGMRWVGILTPVGGMCFLGGWGWCAWRLWRSG